MNSLDILYTPLISLREPPKFNLQDMLAWAEKYKISQEISHRRDTSKRTNNYPWNVVYPKYQDEWRNGFNTEFPEIAEYFSSAYEVNDSDIHSIVLLPIRDTFSGVGFWHSDPDIFGLRMYLENSEGENFLLIRPSILPYTERHNDLNIKNSEETSIDVLQKDKIYSATLLHPRQTFYINNIRAVHAVNTKMAGVPRIAIIVSLHHRVKHHVENLIVRSAEHYKEHAIMWTPPGHS